MFNFGLYKEGLRKTRTLAILFLIGMILGGIVQPLAELSYYRGWEEGHINQVYGLQASYMMVFALFAGAPVLTLSIFSFLNKRSSSDFYHSIPHKRETLFGSFIAAVLTWVLGGMWVSTAIAVTIYTLSPDTVVHLGSIILVLIGMSAAGLLVISATTLAMAVTGSQLSNITTAGLIIFLPRLLTTIFIGIIVEATGVIGFGDFGLLENYNIVFGLVSDRSNINQMITSGTVYTFVLAIIYLVVACYLFKKRHSELAGNPGSKVTQPIIRIAVTFMLTIPAMMLMLSWESDKLWASFTIYLISLVVYFAYEYMTTKKIPQLNKMVPGLLILVFLNFGFLAGVSMAYGMILQEINVEDISSVSIANQWTRQTYSYADLNAIGLVITDEQVVASLGKTLNDRIEESEARLRGNTTQGWWHSREIRVTFNLDGGRHVTRRIGFNHDTHLLGGLTDYEPYQAMYSAIPEDFDEAHSRHDLTRDEIDHVLDVLRDEVQEVDFASWYRVMEGFGDLTQYGMIEVGGMVDGQRYYSWFPITDLTPKALAVYRTYARGNIFSYQGIPIGEAHEVGNVLAILGASYEGMLLSTEEEPYGLTLMNVDMTSEEILSISAFAFVLFPDADWITYEVEDGEMTVSREQIVEFLGQSEFEDEAELINLLQEKFEQEALPGFLEVQ